MRNLRLLTLLGSIVFGATASTFGALYNFSYTFTSNGATQPSGSPSPVVVSGVVEGTPELGGNVIDVSSLLSLTIGGYAISGPLYAQL